MLRAALIPVLVSDQPPCLPHSITAETLHIPALFREETEFLGINVDQEVQTQDLITEASLTEPDTRDRQIRDRQIRDRDRSETAVHAAEAQPRIKPSFWEQITALSS